MTDRQEAGAAQVFAADRQGAGAAQAFIYERTESGAVILRCFSRDARAEIPEWLDGCPVTELGPYAFSEHLDEEKLWESVRAGRARLYVPELLRLGAGAPEGDEEAARAAKSLCGGRLEELVLPPSLRRVGRYCFYNCGGLRSLELYGALSDWGSGVFTGCHHVKHLRVWAGVSGTSHLKDVLDELHEELDVEYLVCTPEAAEQTELRRSSAGEADGRDTAGHALTWTAARLVFPEFYEEGVENTPARILETHVHGSGLLYRNCFRGRAFDFAQYDVLFPYAKAQESRELAARMALGRLRFPYGLTGRARGQYEDYAAEHADEIAGLLLRQRDLDGLRFLLGLLRARASGGNAGEGGGLAEAARASADTGYPLPGAFLNRAIEAASGLGYMEAVSFLMEQARAGEARRPARRRFEL